MKKSKYKPKRVKDLELLGRRSGCEFNIKHGNNIAVYIPAFPEYGLGNDMEDEIKSYLASGTPTAIEIIARAKRQAFKEDFGPAWNYVFNYFTSEEIKYRKKLFAMWKNLI